MKSESWPSFRSLVATIRREHASGHAKAEAHKLLRKKIGRIIVHWAYVYDKTLSTQDVEDVISDIVWTISKEGFSAEIVNSVRFHRRVMTTIFNICNQSYRKLTKESEWSEQIEQTAAGQDESGFFTQLGLTDESFLAEWLNQLKNDRHRELIQLHYFQGLSLQEIADMWGINVNKMHYDAKQQLAHIGLLLFASKRDQYPERRIQICIDRLPSDMQIVLRAWWSGIKSYAALARLFDKPVDIKRLLVDGVNQLFLCLSS